MKRRSDDLDPVLTLLGMEDETGILHIPYFGSEKNEIFQRGIPLRKIKVMT